MSEPSTPLMRQYSRDQERASQRASVLPAGRFLRALLRRRGGRRARAADYADLAQQGKRHRDSHVRRALSLRRELHRQAHPQGIQSRHLRADGRPAAGQEAGQARSDTRAHPGHCGRRASGLGGEQLSGCVARAGNAAGFAALDLSTGEFRATEFVGEDAERRIREELLVLRPREVLFASSLPLFDQPRSNASVPRRLPLRASHRWKTRVGPRRPLDDWVFAPDYAIPQVENHFGVLSLEGFGLANRRPQQPPRPAPSCITFAPRSAARSTTLTVSAFMSGKTAWCWMP